MTSAPGSGERLQKVLARAGFGSRRVCENLIRAGRVTVNGRRPELGARVDVHTDVVAVDGTTVDLAPGLVYLALNKPAGVLSAASDPQGRPVVTHLVPANPRVFPVGRLDRDTSGLLLLTNDGDFANRVVHPRYGVAKTYLAEVRGRLTDRSVARLRRGIELDDGPAAAEEVRVRASNQGRRLVELTVREGRNRLVRRLLEAAGAEVLGLTRIAIGPLRLGHLRPGSWRELGRDEVMSLLEAAGDGEEGPVH